MLGSARPPLGRYRESMPSTRCQANLLLTLTAAIWGLAFVAQRVGADHLGPFAFNGIRFALGSLSLLPVLIVVQRRAGAAPRTAGNAAPILLPGLLTGAVLFAASALQQAGIAETTAGKAGFITGFYIVLVPLLGIALRHPAGPRIWIGAVLALAGLYLLSVTDAFTLARGDALVLAGAIFWAVHILLIDRYAGQVGAVRLAFAQFVTCAVLSVGTALLVETAPFVGVPAAMWPLFYGGVMSVGVAYTLQVVAQRAAAPSHAALILSTEAVFAVIGGVLLLGETMTVRAMTGCALILAGILVSQSDAGQLPSDQGRVWSRQTSYPRRTASDGGARQRHRSVPG